MVYSEHTDSQDDDDSVVTLSTMDRYLAGDESGDRREDESESEKALRDRIIKQEEAAVRRARIAVIVAILAAAIAVSVSIYLFAVQSDKTSFELEFTGYTKDIVALVQWEVTYDMTLMQQLSASMTATAASLNASFPFLTDPHYEVTGGYADGMSGIMSASFAPLVTVEQREQWENYSVANQGWIAESKFLKTVHPGHRDPLHFTIQDHEDDRRLQQEEIPRISPVIYRWLDGERRPETNEPGKVFAPLWQVSPAAPEAINTNLLSDERIVQLFNVASATKQTIWSATTPIGDMFDFNFDPIEKPRKINPHAFIMEPVYDVFGENPSAVGFLVGLTSFGNLFDRLLPEGANGVICVVSDTCGNDITFELNGQQSTFLGNEDLHDPAYDGWGVHTNVEFYRTELEEMCVHTLSIYPSVTFEQSYNTNKPAIYTAVVALAFFVTSILLLIYDMLVTRRQAKTMKSALRATRFVSTLFPENVRDRVMDDAQNADKEKTKNEFFNDEQNDLGGEEISYGLYKTKPIADFFPNTTVMFADISNFTAWSSTREPFQVFLLLETLYGAFDVIAKRRRVFKVETVGDCYVAVAGVPTPRKDHAVAMAAFARDCIVKMYELTRKLEVTLGPDTTELALRVGLHSGPVTGGVLRGENARFQLFGDTMNCASRIESTGRPNRVQLSSTTAQLLEAAGKSHWMQKREEAVMAKGKGKLETYWLTMEMAPTTATASTTSDISVPAMDEHGQPVRERGVDHSVPTSHISDNANVKADKADKAAKNARLVDWNTAVLLQRLKAVVKARGDSEDLDPMVAEQLRAFVQECANLYNDNPFHNFEHASHVTMSVTKLLARVVTFDDSDKAHLYTKTINTDPMTQFAVVFSALVHDVDHAGVPNAQLVAEKAEVAQRFSKSVAENNSIQVAWQLFIEPGFSKLRVCLCPRRTDLIRLHELIVNIVLATDIVDQDLKEERNARWAKVFSEHANSASNIDQLKATIVLEHLIQASDVCHTMQHWHIYRKWNERFFEECYKAYRDGRAEKNPAETWYKGEIGFFDFYIIPLAEKLDECGVFGVSSDEFLNYAKSNRREWELKGQEIVESLVEKYCLQDYNKVDEISPRRSQVLQQVTKALVSTKAEGTLVKEKKTKENGSAELPMSVNKAADMSLEQLVQKHLTRSINEASSDLLFI